MEDLGGGVEGTPGWPLEPGMTLGKYRIVRFLGEGGMGAVYEGLHVEIGKRVAIKTISPALAEIPEARARFLLEAQLTSRVGHPHTVDVTDICMEGGQAFLVMEYLDGEDLARHLRRCGPLPCDEVVDIALPILAAIAAAHDEGIVHRDLKPPNIFLAEMRDGSIHPKVLDFGISKAPALAAFTSVRTSGAILGSPSYFAPEQVNDPKAISPASDQYSLGVILYECVTGRLPYEGPSLAAIFQAIMEGNHEPASAHRPDLPEAFQSVIARAMSHAPGDRYADVREMGRALLELASPKTRLLWQDQFAGTPASAQSPVPVTDQTPGPTHSPLSVTAWMPGDRRAEIVEARRWIPPTPSAWFDDPSDSLAVPRRFHPARWALGTGALAVALSLAFVVGTHSRTRAPTSSQPPSPPSAVTAPPGTPAAPTDNRLGDAKPRAAAQAKAVATPTPASTPRTARSAGPAHRPRFGPNRAPLIE
jgi:eukaryotic-like serine/threonine-protein kinase